MVGVWRDQISRYRVCLGSSHSHKHHHSRHCPALVLVIWPERDQKPLGLVLPEPRCGCFLDLSGQAWPRISSFFSCSALVLKSGPLFKTVSSLCPSTSHFQPDWTLVELASFSERKIYLRIAFHFPSSSFSTDLFLTSHTTFSFGYSLPFRRTLI